MRISGSHIGTGHPTANCLLANNPRRISGQMTIWVAGFPVSTGPFRDGQWQVNIEEAFVPSSLTPVLVSANRPLRQALGTDVSNLPTKEEVRRAVLRGQPNVAYDTAPWDCNSASFRNELEGWWPDAPNLHNRVHVWVRGDMGPATSPNDPVFFLNHCNVDRIWEDWQQRHANPPYLRPHNGDGTTALRGHRLNDWLFGMTTSDLFDSIYHGRVRPAVLLDVSARYIYDSF
jgi:tyrosinase